MESVVDRYNGIDWIMRSMDYEKNSTRRQDISCLGTINCNLIRFSRCIRLIAETGKTPVGREWPPGSDDGGPCWSVVDSYMRIISPK